MTDKRSTTSWLHIDYQPHRIQQSGGSPEVAAPNSVELPAADVGESYDLGDVMTFEAEGISVDAP